MSGKKMVYTGNIGNPLHGVNTDTSRKMNTDKKKKCKYWG